MNEQDSSAHILLNRAPDAAYMEEWTKLLQGEVTIKKEDRASVVLFRLSSEWLAIATEICSEIAPMRTLHHIPHRSGPLLLGLMNLRGQLGLCISMHRLLDLEEPREQKRIMALRKGEEKWIFPVDEVYGNFYYSKDLLQNVPVTVSKSAANYFRGVISWEGKNVGILDEDLLFQSLRRIVQ